MGEERFVERPQDRVADTRLADVDDRAQRVCKPAECPALLARELWSGG